jgi:AraC family transcriptional regulator, positive regulator of tynA and feaB
MVEARISTFPAPGRSAAMAAPGALHTHATDDVPEPHRLAYWRDGVMRRLEPVGAPDHARPFRAKLTRVQGTNAEFVDAASDAIVGTRDLRRCRRDGCDDISFDLMASGSAHVVTDERAYGLRAGDIAIVDCSRPVRINRSRHRALSLLIPRDQFSAVQCDPTMFAGRVLRPHGMVGLLRSHLRAIADQAAHLQPEQRILAVGVATEMALSVLQIETRGSMDAERFETGLYHAARALIYRHCTDPDFVPERVAAALKCSRTVLYRAFAGREQSVAAMIWSARIEHAQGMLTSPLYSDLLIGEIAFRSGFVDHPTFNRMFRRRYGISPQEARAGG